MPQQPPLPANTEKVIDEATVQINTDQSDISDQATIAGTGEVKPAINSDKLPTLPGYSITGVLGRGGMGVVYQALQRPLNRPVALKMIISGEHAGAEDRLRFLAEAESIAKIQHPGIVQLYEFGSHEGHPYFALEYVTGGTLEKKLSGTPLPPREAAALIEKLARAMQAAHDLGIVHRDLKPANILLTPAGEPKITDFGLAKSGGSNLTATGAILGTPSFMAPEQADGQKSVGPLADVYSLGAILYTCLTGRPPFKASTHVDTILQVVNNEPVSVCALQKQTPKDLETICHKCLSKQPENRYGSAALLAEDLRRFLYGETILARPSSRMLKTWRWCKRNRIVASLSFVTVALLAGFMTMIFINSEQTKTDSTLTGYAGIAEKDRIDSEKRIASLRYLASLDGHYHPEATDELIESLRGDRIEPVRLQAAKTLATGKFANKKTIEALIQCVSNNTKDGFPREDSEAVRNAAILALNTSLIKYNGSPLPKEYLAMANYYAGNFQQVLEIVEKEILDGKNSSVSLSQRVHTYELVLALAPPLTSPSDWIGGICMIPIIVIYESYQPTNLVFQAMAQYRLGMKEKSQQTRRLLAVVMKRPEFKNINTKELDEMLVLPVQKQMLSTPLAE